MGYRCPGTGEQVVLMVCLALLLDLLWDATNEWVLQNYLCKVLVTCLKLIGEFLVWMALHWFVLLKLCSGNLFGWGCFFSAWYKWIGSIKTKVINCPFYPVGHSAHSLFLSPLFLLSPFGVCVCVCDFFPLYFCVVTFFFICSWTSKRKGLLSSKKNTYNLLVMHKFSL